MAELKTAIGVHISGRTLRRVEVERSGSGLRLRRAESLPLAAASGTTASMAGLPRGAADRPDERIVAALPALDVMTRCWTFPEGGEARVRQMVANRLEAESPVPVEELTWAYRLGPRLNGRADRSVLVQAARNNRIAQQLAGLAAANCRPHLLTSETEAIGALMRHGLGGGETGPELLVLAGADEWLACVLADGLTRSVRHVRAEAARRDLACREVRQLVETELGQGRLKRIRWCGEDPESEAHRVLEDWLPVPVVPFEIDERVVNADGTRLRPAELAVYGPAIGLALAGIHDDRTLIGLAGVKEEAELRGRLDRLLAHPWRCTAAAVGLLVLAVLLHVIILRHETRLMKAAVEQSPAPMAGLDPKVRAMQRLERYRIDVEGIMAELSRTIPSSVIVSSVQLSRERRLVMKGTARDPKAIYGWIEALKKCGRFSTVNPERTAPGQGGDFTITAEPVGIQKLTTVGGRGESWR
ncbi:MAG: hypothetical protein HY718_13295 [Planctomycetes bacterium]|nr:hypothetical protein [Planctomycetota bacterium]